VRAQSVLTGEEVTAELQPFHPLRCASDGCQTAPATFRTGSRRARPDTLPV
jgi:hypothetical protein